MRLEKQQLRKRWSEIRTLVNDWDPLGLIAVGAPLDEYECVVGPLLRMLESGTPAPEIAKWLTHEFEDHFGAAAFDVPGFVSQAVAWYAQGWPGTTSP